MDAAGVREMGGFADAGEITGSAGGKFFQDLEGGVGRRPRAEATAAAPGIGDEFEDGEAAQGPAGSAGDFFRGGKAAECRDGDAGFGGGLRRREGADEGGEGVVVRSVRGDEGGADGAARDEAMGETVEEREIGLGRRATWTVAARAVSVALGSTTISGRRRFIMTRCHMIGWAMQGLAPIKIRASPLSKSAPVKGEASKPKDCFSATCERAMHSRVLLSQCGAPMPNLKSAPTSAIFSVMIWPVLRQAMEEVTLSR